MILRLMQIVLMLAVTGLSYWAWQELNILRGTVFFEYRYVILMTGAILLFSIAQSVVGWIDLRLNPEDP